MSEQNTKKGNLFGLMPLLVFLVIYISSAIITKDFYKMPVTVSFLISAIFAIFMNRKESLTKKIDIFCKGAGEANIILMCIIFILAGAFAQVARDMGAVDSTVNLGLTVLPSNILITGVFIISCFISISIGTSMGTIVALTPMAIGISEKSGITMALCIAAVVGGSMFGDNLSMISDTTIAAARTQGCKMRDKFKMNFRIVFPAAIITAIILAIVSAGQGISINQNYDYNIVKVIPYICVLGAALFGINVIIVLIGGTVLAGSIGIGYGTFDFWGFISSLEKGIVGMEDLIIISLLVGGIVELIKYNGGIDFIINFISKRVKTKKGAEFGIAALVSLVNICTANNTIAIVMTGPLAKDISEKYNIEPRRTASLLDIFSCFCQGLVPYGAQLLAAAQIAKISPVIIMQYLYYPYLTGICAILAIIFCIPKVKVNNKEQISNIK